MPVSVCDNLHKCYLLLSLLMLTVAVFLPTIDVSTVMRCIVYYDWLYIQIVIVRLLLNKKQNQNLVLIKCIIVHRRNFERLFFSKV